MVVATVEGAQNSDKRIVQPDVFLAPHPVAIVLAEKVTGLIVDVLRHVSDKASLLENALSSTVVGIAR